MKKLPNQKVIICYSYIYLNIWVKALTSQGLWISIGTSLQLTLQVSTSEPGCTDSVLCNESLWQLGWLPEFASEVVQLHFHSPVFKDLSWHCNSFSLSLRLSKIQSHLFTYKHILHIFASSVNHDFPPQNTNYWNTLMRNRNVQNFLYLHNHCQ